MQHSAALPDIFIGHDAGILRIVMPISAVIAFPGQVQGPLCGVERAACELIVPEQSPLGAGKRQKVTPGKCRRHGTEVCGRHRRQYEHGYRRGEKKCCREKSLPYHGLRVVQGSGALWYRCPAQKATHGRFQFVKK